MWYAEFHYFTWSTRGTPGRRGGVHGERGKVGVFFALVVVVVVTMRQSTPRKCIYNKYVTGAGSSATVSWLLPPEGHRNNNTPKRKKK